MNPEMLSFVMAEDQWREPYVDLTSDFPDVPDHDAYSLQFAAMEQRAKAGNPIVGYKAANTSPAATKVIGLGSGIIVGTLLDSQIFPSGSRIDMRPGSNHVEIEIALTLGTPLAGPDLTVEDVRAAIGIVHPAIEIAPWSPAVVAGKRSRPHTIATHKTSGAIILGPGRPLGDTDLIVETASLDIDGTHIGTGTGANVLGDPLAVVVDLARLLSEHGLSLEPNMLIMTGSILSPHAVPYDPAAPTRTDVAATGRFGTLGDIRVTLAAPIQGEPV